MQDSNITYTVKAVGAEEAQAKFKQLGATIQRMTVNQNGTVTASGKLTSALDEQGKATGRAADATDRASKSHASYFSHIAKTTVQSALINKLFLEFVDVAGQAIQQVDLMNNFPVTMSSMGQSTKDSTEAMKELSSYVGQVGGNLGDATSMVTRFTGVTNNVKAATAIYEGLNNALIAGDTTLEEQKNATLQFSQALERGKPDMREWNTLSTVMSQQLGIVAKNMGYVNANQLGQALRDGKESMANFTTELTKVSTGTGVVAEQAYARMNGMQFAFNVMKNTMVQGLATLINAFGRANIVSFFTLITQTIQILISRAVSMINILGTLANVISGLFGGGEVFKKVTGDADAMAGSLGKGANAAGDMGDNLQGAKDDADKLTKSLAGFDKMNVLPDKTSGKSKDTGAGGTSFDAAQIAELGKLTGGMTKGLKEAGIWAKILADVIGGISALMTIGRIIDYYNKWEERIKSVTKNMGSLKGTMDDMNKSFEKGLFKGMDDGNKVKSAGEKLGTSFGSGIMGGIGGVIGGMSTKLAPVLVAALAPLGAAISGALAAGAAALGVSVGVFVGIIALAVIAIVALIWVIYKNWDTIWGFIKDVASTAWQGIQKIWDGITGFFVGVWQSIVDTLRPVLDVVGILFSNAWIVIKALGTIALGILLIPFQLLISTLSALAAAVTWVAEWLWTQFQNAWNKIVGIFGAVFGFFKGVVVNIYNAIIDVVLIFAQVFTDAFNQVVAVFVGLALWFYNNVVLKIMSFISPFTNWLGDQFRAAWNAITAVFSVASQWFVTNVVNPIMTALAPLINWIANSFSNVWNNIKDGFVRVWDSIKGLLSGFDPVGLVKGGINSLFGALERVVNSFIAVYRSIWNLMDKAPGGMIMPKPPADIKLQRLARGGVVEKATTALIGEAGTEAVVPLENNTEWIDKLAAKINTAMGGSSSQPLQLTVQIGEDRIVTKVIDLINEKTQMSGRNAIVV